LLYVLPVAKLPAFLGSCPVLVATTAKNGIRILLLLLLLPATFVHPSLIINPLIWFGWLVLIPRGKKNTAKST
jgi:hypothetical protein